MIISCFFCRCENALKGNVPIDPKVDGGQWYDIKRLPTTKSNQVPYLPIQGWKKFPSSSIPKHFNSGHIYHYLVETITTLNSSHTTNDSDDDVECPEDVHTSKPFTKGKNLYRSGHVKNMQNSTQKGNFFVKANVMASYSQVSYNSTITLSETSGTVKEGTCTCSASGMGRCAHVAALLFALEDYVTEFGTDLPTCTDKLVQWNKGRRKNKTPAAVFDKEYPAMKKEKKRKKTSGNEILKSDPRPAPLRENNITIEKQNEFVRDLNYTGIGDCGWTNLLDYFYEDFSLEDFVTGELNLQCKQFIANLEAVCQASNKPYLVENTMGQGTSSQWQANRWCRITASMAKDVKCVKTGFTGLVKRLLWSEIPITAAIQYGRDHESDALKCYKDKYMSYLVEETGLWLNPKYPTLACSPDGTFEDQQTGISGLIEIKCPYVMREMHPIHDFDKLTTKQARDFCCTSQSDSSLKLKRNHKYYYQVQMQMGICEKKVCDFVIWSQKGLSIERIHFDKSFWDYTYPCLERFHREYLVPEFFLMRIPRELEPLHCEY